MEWTLIFLFSSASASTSTSFVHGVYPSLSDFFLVSSKDKIQVFEENEALTTLEAPYPSEVSMSSRPQLNDWSVRNSSSSILVLIDKPWRLPFP